MKYFNKFKLLFTLILVVSLSSIGTSQICESVETFDEFVSGSVLPGPMAPGYFTAYGNIKIVEQNCPVGEPGLSARIKASVNGSQGDALGYTTTGGFTGGEPFHAGQEYVFSGMKMLRFDNLDNYQNPILKIRLTNSLNIGNGCPSGDCELVISKSIAELQVNQCNQWGSMPFNPGADYDYFIISVEADNDTGEDELFIAVDNWCVAAAPLEGCEASFVAEEGDCGNIQLINTSENGSVLSWLIQGVNYSDMGTGETYSTKLPSPGTYLIWLTVTCADGSTTTSPQPLTINPPWDTVPPVFESCPVEPITVIATNQECVVEYMIPDLGVTDNVGVTNYECRIDGNIVPQATFVTLMVGSHTVLCVAEDQCGNEDTCNYEIIVECESNYDCTDFNQEYSGNWKKYNKISGNIWPPSTISLGSPGPSGVPSDRHLVFADSPGDTWAYNSIDYDGDYTQDLGSCICYDYNIFDDSDDGMLPVKTRIFLTSPINPANTIVFGINPVTAIVFESFNPVTQQDGWQHICAPIELCDASGNLPSNGYGEWKWVSGVTQDCNEYQNLLANVETMMFRLDFTSSPSEILYVDNICVGPCDDPNPPCDFETTVDTFPQENGQCCYKFDLDAQSGWSSICYRLNTPGVIFNTSMVDTSLFQLDTFNNGTKICIYDKMPSRGIPAGFHGDFLKFCFANVDSASQSPQCVIAEYFVPGPVDIPELACRDTLKFHCIPPSETQDTCLTLELNAECDEEDPNRYKLTFSVTNMSNFTANQVVLTSLDPNVKFLPIGAPSSIIPQSTIGVSLGSLAPTMTATGLMVTVVTTVAITSPQQFCIEGNIWNGGMCCTSPTEFCTELDVCCDPCEMKGYEVEDISGILVPQTTSYSAIDDGQLSSVQGGMPFDVTGPGLRIETFDFNTNSSGETINSYINFDFIQDLCEGAEITKAELRLYANTSSSGHITSIVDPTCYKLGRVIDPWSELTLPTTVPNTTTTNEITLTPPSFQYENYQVDVTTLINDMIANPATAHGFYMTASCPENIYMEFASKDHPNTALHPQLVISYSDEDCEEPSLEGECCHALDIINPCETDFFTKVEIVTNTPGVIIGSHKTGGPTRADWYNSKSTSTCITWEHTSGHIPTGTTAGLIEFCLDDIDAGETPQEVILNWYATSGNGEMYIACADTLIFECEPPVDNKCITVIETEIKNSPCDSLDCYEEPFCLQWLRDLTATAQANTTIEKGYWMGQPVFIVTFTPPTGGADYGGTAIYLCNGNIVQDCTISIAGEACVPDAGIDTGTDITQKVQIWMTGDVLPPLDPNCGSGSGSQNVVDVCVTFKNEGQHFATDLMINPITSGVTPFPSPIDLMPTGSNPCDTTTVAFQLFGPAVVPGATLKFAVRLKDRFDSDHWCCFESDTVCVIIPECPVGMVCDSVDVTNGPSVQEDSTCCSTFTIDNKWSGTYFKGIKIHVDAPANISQVAGLNGWIINQLDNQNAEIYPPSGGNIPLGSLDVFTLCTQGYNTGPHTVTVTWLVQGPDGECLEKCPKELQMECENDDEKKCYSLVQDSIDCVTSTYCFQIENTSNPAFDLYSVELVNLTGGLTISPTGRINIPNAPLTSGQTSDWICVTYSGVNPGDNVCYGLSAHNQPRNEPTSQCCTDTIVNCFDIPECPNDCCENIDTMAVDSYYRNSLTITYSECEACWSVTPDSCDIVSIDFNDGFGFRPFSGTICKTYASNGGYNYVFKIERFTSDGELCFDHEISGLVVIENCEGDVCCEDEEAFDANIALGFMVTDLGNCTYEVCLNQFDDCHWFGDIAPNWGDGPSLPVLTQSDPPNNCWTHTYSGTGPYTISMTVYEQFDDNGEFCWSDEITTVVECPEGSVCDSVDVTKGPAVQLDSTCCTTFTIDNNWSSTYFKGIKVHVDSPVNISQVQSLNGWFINQLDNQNAEIYPPSGGNIPLGTLDVFTLCTQGYNTGAHTVTVTWLVQGPNGECLEECPKELEVECDDDEPLKCFEFIADSTDCPTSTYCFKIKNTSNPAFDFSSMSLYNLTGGLVVSPSGNINIPNAPLMSGQTSDWICVTYSGVNPGDNVCYSLRAENKSQGIPSNICCTDTIVKCFDIPECEPQSATCGDCPDGQLKGPNLIVNGDFESGNTGFTSDYIFSMTNVLSAGDYGVRNSTTLVNGAWAATDHTTGSAMGQFLVVDADLNASNSFWKQTVATVPGQVYNLCLFYDNLIDESALIDSSPATLEVLINGVIVTTAAVNQLPDSWQNITFNYTAVLPITNLELSIGTAITVLYDVAIDDITFTTCGLILSDCCSNLDTTAICNYYDSNINVSVVECEACITLTPDSCDIISIDLNDGNGYVPYQGTICRTFTANGTYPYMVKIQRLNDAEELCFEKIIDGVFVIENCGGGGDTCCEITEEEFCSKWDLGWNGYTNQDCEVCIPLVLDSCDHINLNWGDGTTWSSMGGGMLPCYSYSQSGVYTIDVTYFRLGSMAGDTCQLKDTTITIETDCPPASSTCLQVIDGELDCDNDVYCFRITNTSSPGFTMKSLAFIELTPGVFLSPDPYQFQTPLLPGNTSELICLSYTGAFLGDTICFDVVGHQEDITIGEEPIFCCKDTLPVCFVLDCPTVRSSCISVVDDSLHCESNTYCIKVRNNTSGPGFTMRSVAFYNMSMGHSFTPSPVGIPDLLPGTTSDWICVTYSGASMGDDICYGIVGHEQDLSSGQEPQFCCADTTEYCFRVDCEPDPCCEMTIDELRDYLIGGITYTQDDCEICLPFAEDTCAVISIAFGDGDISESTGGGEICHTYSIDGTILIEILIQRFNDAGEVCLELDTMISVTVDGCEGNRPPCTVDDMDIFNALSPNSDGLNDILIINDDGTCRKNIKIFNRWGQLVFEKVDYNNDWEGTSFSGEQLVEGTYFLIIEIPDNEGNIIEMKQIYIDIRK